MISNIDMENFIKDFSCNCKNVQKKAFKKGQTIKLLYADEERQTFYADIDGVKGYLYSGNYFG